MKTSKIAIALFISTIAFVLPSLAQDNAKQNPAFEKMKNNLGKWEGTLERSGKKIHQKENMKI